MGNGKKEIGKECRLNGADDVDRGDYETAPNNSTSSHLIDNDKTLVIAAAHFDRLRGSTEAD